MAQCRYISEVKFGKLGKDYGKEGGSVDVIKQRNMCSSLMIQGSHDGLVSLRGAGAVMKHGHDLQQLLHTAEYISISIFTVISEKHHNSSVHFARRSN